MNFSSAMQYLRAAQCAKTPSMNGYVKREDWPANTQDTAVAALYANGATKVYDLTFVENAAYVPGSSDSGNTSAVARVYVFRVKEGTRPADPLPSGVVWDKSNWDYLGTKLPADASLDPAAPLGMDNLLLKLVATSNDWTIETTADVESAITSSDRW